LAVGPLRQREGLPQRLVRLLGAAELLAEAGGLEEEVALPRPAGLDARVNGGGVLLSVARFQGRRSVALEVEVLRRERPRALERLEGRPGPVHLEPDLPEEVVGVEVVV